MAMVDRPVPGSGGSAMPAWSPAFDYTLRLWRQEPGAAPGSGRVDAAAFARTLSQHRLALALPAAGALDAAMPGPLREVLRRRQRRMTLHTLQQAAALREIVTALGAAGVRYCLLKGQGFAALFDAPQRREACDIDVLVEACDCRAALARLQALGYVLDPAAAADPQRHAIDNHALELRHAGTGVVLELHLRLANQARQFPLQGPALWERHTTVVSLAGMDMVTLAPPAAVVYAAFHGTKHNWHRAFWLVDMALAMRGTAVDWSAALALAQALGVERQLAMSVLLAEAVLGAPVPPALWERADLLRVARPAAEQLLPHLDALGSDRGAELAARLGMVRYVLRLWSLQSGWRGRLQLVPFLLAPTDDDRQALALPRWLHWAYPAVRALRLVRQHLARRQRG